MGHLNPRRFLSFTLLSAAASAWGCGVLDWLIGGHIDVNGSRATISQERGYVGNTMKGYLLFGTQNHFRSVDIAAMLTGGQTCGEGAPLYSLDDSERQERCVECAFYCFNRAIGIHDSITESWQRTAGGNQLQSVTGGW